MKLLEPIPLVFPPRAGIYPVQIASVTDGDTVRFWWLVADMGRLAGINAPELHGPTREAGQAAKEFLAGLLSVGHLVAKVTGRDKYGRALLELFVGDQSINRAMVAAGHAVPYMEGRT